MKHTTIVLAGRDQARCDKLAALLRRDGYAVVVTKDWQELRHTRENGGADLLVLHLDALAQSSPQAWRTLLAGTHLPVIVVAAGGNPLDALLDPDIEVADYLVEPVTPRDLLLSVRRLLRQTRNDSMATRCTVLTAGDLVIDRDKHLVLRQGQAVTLTPSEFELLWALALAPGRVLSRLQLMETALGADYGARERTLDKHIEHLRRKLEPDPSQPRYVQTVVGVGYRFAPYDRQQSTSVVLHLAAAPPDGSPSLGLHSQTAEPLCGTTQGTQ